MKYLCPDVHGFQIPFGSIRRQIGSKLFGDMEFEKSGKNGSVFRVEIVVFAPDTVVGQLVAAAFQHGTAQIHMSEAGFGSNCGKLFQLLGL